MNSSKQQRFLGQGRYRVTPPAQNHIWVLVADRSKARIFRKTGKSLMPIEEFINPEGKARVSDLVSDKPGRSFDSHSGKLRSGARHSYHDNRTLQDTVEEKFAHDLAEILSTAQKQNRFQELVLLAEPHFMGLLRQRLSETTAQRVSHFYARDFSWVGDHELIDRLKQLV